MGRSLKQIESSRGGDCYLAQSYSVSNIFSERQVKFPAGLKRLTIVHVLKAKTAAGVRRRSTRPAHTLITLGADRAARSNKCLQLRSLWGEKKKVCVITDEAGMNRFVDADEDEERKKKDRGRGPLLGRGLFATGARTEILLKIYFIDYQSLKCCFI